MKARKCISWFQGTILLQTRMSHKLLFFSFFVLKRKCMKRCKPSGNKSPSPGKEKLSFPSTIFSGECNYFSDQLKLFPFLFFFDTGQKANMNYLSEVTGAKRKNSRGSEGVEAEDNHQTGTVVYFILNMQIYIKNGLHRFSG